MDAVRVRHCRKRRLFKLEELFVHFCYELHDMDWHQFALRSVALSRSVSHVRSYSVQDKRCTQSPEYARIAHECKYKLEYQRSTRLDVDRLNLRSSHQPRKYRLVRSRPLSQRMASGFP
jgi:hypothetical protein